MVTTMNSAQMEQQMSKIWAIFDILKKSSKVTSVLEQAEITLLLLSLYKDGMMTDDLLNSPTIVNEPDVVHSYILPLS